MGKPVNNIEKMNELLKIQGSAGNYNYDSYMLGMYNGMELMVSISEGREPNYKTLKDEEFICNKKNAKNPVLQADKKINLCDTCKFEIPSCKATEEGVDFKFGHGLGNDNVYECKIYESESEEI